MNRISGQTRLLSQNSKKGSCDQSRFQNTQKYFIELKTLGKIDKSCVTDIESTCPQKVSDLVASQIQIAVSQFSGVELMVEEFDRDLAAQTSIDLESSAIMTNI